MLIYFVTEAYLLSLYIPLDNKLKSSLGLIDKIHAKLDYAFPYEDPDPGIQLISPPNLNSLIKKRKKQISETDSFLNWLKSEEIEGIDRYSQKITELVPQALNLMLKTPTDNFYLTDLSAVRIMGIEAVDALYKNLAFKEYPELKSEFENEIRRREKNGEFLNHLWGKTDNEIRDVVNEMTLEEKAGQILVFNLNGTALSAENENLFKTIKPGGVIHLGYNIASASQITELNKKIKQINSKIPPFIMVDQEGGPVKRISWDYTAGANSWAGLTDNALCDLAILRSKLMFSLGFNVNFAPVVDLNYPHNSFLNNRTISSDPFVIARAAKKFIECSRTQKIFTSMKHYPGHGPSATDSHYYLPVITKSKQDWLATDAIPYINITDAPFIMTGHLWYKNIDPDNPSTTSKIFLQEILKNEFKSKSILITDDLNMLYRSSKRPIREIIRDSLNAGNDMLLFVGAPESKQSIHNYIIELVKEGEVSEKNLNESVEKILKLKRYIAG